MTPADNLALIEYWNTKAGPTWVAYQEQLDRLLGPLGERLVGHVAPLPGEHILDVGCGTGQTSIDLAEAVGSSGKVTGVDVTFTMLDAARRRAASRGVDLELLAADAQDHSFDSAAYDAVVSRFGVMFFADPIAAFSNLRRALRPQGRLVFVCWQGVEENPWVQKPMAAVAQHVALPERPAPGSPGPFSLGDADRTRELLENAGYRSVTIEGVHQALILGNDVEEAFQFLLEIGPTARALAEAASGDREAALGALRQMLEAHASGGDICLDSAAWLVHARPAA